VSPSVQQGPTELVVDVSALRHLLAPLSHSKDLVLIKGVPVLNQLIRWTQHLIEKDVVAGFGGGIMLDSQFSRRESIEYVVLVLKLEGLDCLFRKVLFQRVIVVGLQLTAHGIVFAEERDHFCELRC
jgi:hypothetical protein